MAVAHDAQTRFPVTNTTGFDTTTGDRTFTHTPVGTPKGVIVVVQSAATAQPCTGVLYGGVAMTLRTSATDTSEAGSVWVWTLTDTTIPTGAQTVTLQGCTADSKFATCSTVTAATTITRYHASAKVDTTTSANPTVNIVTTLSSMIYGGVHGGAAAPTSYAPTASYTTQFDGDYGALSARSSRSTAAIASGTIAYGFTFATSDDWCIACVALAEPVAPTITSMSANDSGRAYADQSGGPYQDISISFSEAMTKSGGSYAVGDTIPGLTIQVAGGSELPVTYRSGEDTTDWIVRIAQQVANGQSLVLDYVQATGELLSVSSTLELQAYTNQTITNNLSKLIRPLLKKADGSVAASVSVIGAILEPGGNDPTQASYLAFANDFSTTTDSSGRLVATYTGSAAVGSTVALRAYLLSSALRPIQAFRKNDVTLV